MQPPSDLNRKIVEDLYCEALVLADEVRSIFDLTPVRETGEKADRLRLALSVEGLRTTTRVMHVLAWLLNHRAYYSGELSEFQLRRHSKLPPDRAPEPASLALLEPDTQRLVLHSQTMHQRIARLDAAWRERYEMQPAAILRLRERLGQAVFKA
jgi:regulator of CtrA degradation